MTLFVLYGDCGALKRMFFFFKLFNNNFSFILGIAVVLSGISSTMTAPATESHWWTNPCSIQTVQLRHGRSPAENQLQIFIKMIDSGVFNKLGAIYPDVAHDTPRNSCPRVNAVLQYMKNANNFTQASYIFYESMVELAKLLHKIKAIPVQTDAKYDVNLRNLMYEEVEANLKSVMCEFNDTLTRFEPMRPNSMIVVRAIRKSISSKCFPKTMSLSQTQSVDIDLFKKLKKFFRQSRRILRQQKNKSLGVRKNQRNRNQPGKTRRVNNNRGKGKKKFMKIKRTKQQLSAS